MFCNFVHFYQSLIEKNLYLFEYFVVITSLCSVCSATVVVKHLSQEWKTSENSDDKFQFDNLGLNP